MAVIVALLGIFFAALGVWMLVDGFHNPPYLRWQAVPFALVEFACAAVLFGVAFS